MICVGAMMQNARWRLQDGEGGRKERGEEETEGGGHATLTTAATADVDEVLLSCLRFAATFAKMTSLNYALHDMKS